MLTLATFALAPQLLDAPMAITGGLVDTDALVVCDIDGNGCLDLVGIDHSEGLLGVAYGQIGGTFESVSPLVTLDREALAVEIADLDANGSSDIVTIEPTGMLRVFERSSRGSYEQVSSLSIPGISSLNTNVGLKAGDVDNDGDLDLVTSVEGAFLPVLRAAFIENLGGNGFAPPVPAATQPIEGGIAQLVDINGDGFLDVLVANDDSLALLIGNGSFSPRPVSSVAQNISAITRIEVLDADQDGDIDILASAGGLLRLLPNSGFGFFSDSVFATGVGPGWAATDVDGDGTLDLVAPDAASGGAHLWLGLGGALAGGSTMALPDPLDSVRSAAVADFDGDGTQDVALAGRRRTLAIYMGEQGPYNVGPDPTFLLRAQDVGDEFEGVALGDLDGDGDLDLAGVDPTSRRIQVYETDGPDLPRSVVTSSEALPEIGAIIAGDFNGDGLDDVLLGPNGSSASSNRLTQWSRNEGGFAFAPPADLGFRDSLTRQPRVADVNGDGYDDVLAYSYDFVERMIEVAYGGPGHAIASGTESLFPAGVLQTASRDFILGDLNQDGAAELILRDNQDTSSLRVIWGQASGLDVHQATLLPGIGAPTPAAVADANGDGLADLLFLDGTGPVLYYLAQDSVGGFDPAQRLLEAGHPLERSRVFGDLDADGRVDLVALGSFSSLDSKCGLNRGSPASWEVSTIDWESLDTPQAKIADFNGDGALDLALVDNSIFILKNRRAHPDTAHCNSAVLNSVGEVGLLDFALPAGSSVDTNQVHVTGLPPASFAVVVCSQSLVPPIAIPNSLGSLCLGSPLGRFIGPGQILQTDAIGSASLLIDPARLPLGGLVVAASPGETWFFQAWYRDSAGGLGTSNLTVARSITWR